jgi:hypothetical protein
VRSSRRRSTQVGPTPAPIRVEPPIASRRECLDIQRDAVTSGRGRAIAAAALVTCVAVQFTWPVLARRGAIYIGASVRDAPWLRLLSGGAANDAPPGEGGWGVLGLSDTLRGVYTMAWWTHALSGRTTGESIYDANVLYPTPRSLTYADLQLGVVPAFAPVYLATGDPVWAYDLAQLAGIAGCALAFFVLLHGWTGSTTAGLVAALGSIVAPFRVSSASLLYLSFVPYVPLAFLCVDAVIARRRPLLAACALALCLLLQASSSGYLIFTSFLLVPVYCLGALLESRGPALVRAAASLLAAGLVAIGALALLYRPYLTLAAAGAFGDAAATGGGPAHNPWLLLLWTRPWANVVQHFAGNCGVPLLGLAVMGLLHARARRRWTALAIVVAGTVLALGPALRVGTVAIPLPWDWLARIVPGFTVQRQTYLTSTLVGFGIVCLAGLGAAWVAERARARRAWLLVFVVVAVGAARAYEWRFARANVVQVASDGRVPPVYGWLAANGAARPMLELPNPIPLNSIYAYFSTHHWLPIFNGSYSYPPPGYDEHAAHAAKLLVSPDDAAAFLRDVPVAWVVVHGDLLPPAERTVLASPPPFLEEVARFGADVVYRTRPSGE